MKPVIILHVPWYIGLIVGITAGLIVGLIFGLRYGLGFGLGTLLSIGSIFWLAASFIRHPSITFSILAGTFIFSAWLIILIATIARGVVLLACLSKLRQQEQLSDS
ncbi:MAG: hypothetical protein NTY93_02360 [Candidatus Kaiserbacteria bacterium]|nr:hypothetical protein [Candidatus Kaiserbacteria bacterium]